MQNNLPYQKKKKNPAFIAKRPPRGTQQNKRNTRYYGDVLQHSAQR